jgi:NAD(P)H-hydrate epimerase
MPEHSAQPLSSDYIRSLILPRKKDSYKGDFGHVLIVAGSRGMTGAAVLCGHGALRAGAGLVTVATVASMQPVLAQQLRPEAMTVSLPESSDGTVIPEAFDVIAGYCTRRRITSLVVGPGLGKNAGVAGLVCRMMEELDIPIVLDADGINNSTAATLDARSSRRGLKTILTPHAGEMSRISGVAIDDVRRARTATAVSFAHHHGVVCLLKGAETVISDGTTNFVNTTGNPGMATGGTGDVLAGIIAALVRQVQESSLLSAAVTGAYVHGLAADIVRDEKTEISLLAGDIVDALPAAFKQVILQ